jgi:hypothetical protein
MGRSALVCAVLLSGCGRLHFDATASDSSSDAAFVGGHVWYVKASNTDMGDGFGDAVALSQDGTTLAVGAPYEDSAATGIDGNQASNAAIDSGAVYVFVRSGATWIQQAYIKASNTAAGDRFGQAIALSADGNTLAVTALLEDAVATDSGATYVFARSGTTWTQKAYLKASNPDASDNFGYSVALSGDGATLAVGAFNESSSSTGVNGAQGDNSTAKAGAVYVFVDQGGWLQRAYVKASNPDPDDIFGESIALSADATTLAVGAPLEDSSATGIDGNQADNAMNEAGAAYVFSGGPTNWIQEAYVKPSNTHLYDPTGSYFQFGWGVTLAADGNTLAVGARLEPSALTGIDGAQTDDTAGGAGAVYAFARSGGTWSQSAYIKASNTGTNDFFGQAVALSRDGRTLAVVAPNEDSAARGLDGDQLGNAAADSGAVYVFTRATTWAQSHYVKASNTGAGDATSSVAVSADGSTFAIGAGAEDSAATGVDGDQIDDSAPDSGAVYVLD